MNKASIKRTIRKMLYLLHHRKHDKFYKQVMTMNNIVNSPVAGEQEWIIKWSQLGPKASPIQYRVFSHYIGPNINIVPEDICHDYIEPILNPFRFTGYYSDKNVFDKLFPSGYLPKTLLRKMNGFWFDENYQKINLTPDLFTTLISRASNGRIIVKPSVDGISGIGVQLFYKPIDKDYFINNENCVLSIEYLSAHYGNDIIIQDAVSQHKYISQFNESSANTLRLSMYRSVIDDECHIIGQTLRIGGKGSIVDNAHAGGCFVGINADGTFCHDVMNQFGQKQQMFNEIDFSNDYKFPNWEKVIDFGKSIGKYVPHHRLLALDVALTEDGTPQLIEFNCLYYAAWIFQYSTGTAFGEYTNEILEYCKNHNSELQYTVNL